MDETLAPYKGRNKPESQKEANRAHAKMRGPSERANAQLKSWRILHKLRCCPHRAGHLAKAILVLQHRKPTPTEKGSLRRPQDPARSGERHPRLDQGLERQSPPLHLKQNR
ncbi:hypothetical protein GCM10009678_72160 [Actinomadura kijaniata]